MVAVMEVCVDSIESAINAEKGGASRLELCCALSEGGLTPSPGFLAIVKSVVKIPVFVILRPRSGGDFVYSSKEVEIMRQDACYLKETGADGFVFGALNNDRNVDEEVCKSLLELISPLPVTFHRAFDVTRDPFEALETLVKLGFKRILTSGQESSAEKGVELIKQLVERSKGRIVIMPGAGISKSNVGKILSMTGANEFHASARSPKKLCHKDSKLQMGTVDDSVILVTDESLVKELMNIAKSL